MKNDAANNRMVATVRQKLKCFLKKQKQLFLFLVWRTQTKAVSFTLDDLCSIVSIADIFSGVLLSTSFSEAGLWQYPYILILILNSLQLGAESRMVLHDVLGKLGTAESWHGRHSFWAESCKELCSVVCRAQSFHSEIQAWTQCSNPPSPRTEPHACFPRGK